MKRALLFALSHLAGATLAHAQAAAPPPAATPGQCFARVLTPAVTETITDRVLVTPEREVIERIPAVFDVGNERIMVREETVEFQIVPAEFETVSEEILVEPERVEQRSIPAQYETYTETVTITPERVAWKPGRGLYGRTASTTPPSRRDALSPTATGEVLCRVIVPAVTETVQRTRMVTPPRVEDTVIPAVYETVTRRVEVRPARVEEILVPAEFRDVPTRILVTPEQDRRTVEPAVYKTVSRQEVVGGGDVIWAEVLCETNTTRYKVAEIQGALTDAGYPTRVDGVFGPDTLRSMQAFQQDRGLSEGYLTIDTVEALGINPYARPPDLVYALLRSPTRA